MRKHKKIFVVISIAIITLALLFLLIKKTEKSRYKWYEKMVIYHILPKAFNDTNGDGIGDFNGITEKLDYIKELGANTIYLMPIMDSLTDETKLRSNYGYEVKNLKSINPDLGTEEDFKRLLREAKKRDIRIVIDFVTTVISVENFIFKDILKNPNTSKYKDWIITSDKPLEGPWMNFNDYPQQFTSAAWNKLPNGRYYYSLWGQSPFLQFYNPEVQEYILSVMDYWLDMGVDGFRVDATKHLFINGPGEDLQFHQPENFVFWRKMKKHMMDKYGPDRTLIAETIPIPYNLSYKEDNRATFDSMLGNTMTDEFYIYRKVRVADYLTGSYIAGHFANNLKYQINKLQDRIFYNSDHDGSRIASRFIKPTVNELKLIASILFLNPVHVKIYFGEEIGLEGIKNHHRPDFWLHTPSHTMAWDKSKNGGFSSADKTLMPISEDYLEHNVKAQENDDDSLLSHYKKLIELKNKYADLFFKGDVVHLHNYDEKLYTYFLNNGDEWALVVHNLSDKYKYFKLNLKKYLKDIDLETIFKSNDAIKFKNENGVLNFEKFPSSATIVFKFKDTDKEKYFDVLNTLPDFENNSVRIKYGEEYVSDKNEIIEMDLLDKILYIKKNQGEVTLHGYMETIEKDNTLYIPVYKNKINTDNLKEDFVMPIISEMSHLHIKNSGVEYKFINKNIVDYFNKKISYIEKEKKNTQLKEFGFGEDENFMYFSVLNKNWAMDKNSGLDFSILFNRENDSLGIKELSFWKLPAIKTEKAISAMLNYERHIGEVWFFNNISEVKPMGNDNSQSVLKFNDNNKIYIALSKNLLPAGKYNFATIVWSAGGNWGDLPKNNKVPIVERLPFEKNAKSNFVSKFIRIK